MKIKLFAYLAEQLGDEVELELPEKFDRSEFLRRFKERFSQVEIKTLSVAVNQAFIFDGEAIDLKEVQEIAVIPPVSGG